MTLADHTPPVARDGAGLGGAAFDAADYEARSRAQARELDPDADLAAMAVAFKLILASNHLLRRLESGVHRPAGISWGAFQLLWTIRAYGRLRPNHLSKLAAVSAATVTSVLNTLERDGLVVRRRASADRRVVTVNLTAKGDQLVKECFVRHHARERQWTDELSKANQVTLARLLRRVVEHHPEP